MAHVSEDPKVPEALTTIHFLSGYAHLEGPPGNFDKNKIEDDWQKSQMMANSCWKRWVKEDLPTLNRPRKWTDNRNL